MDLGLETLGFCLVYSFLTLEFKVWFTFSILTLGWRVNLPGQNVNIIFGDLIINFTEYVSLLV